MSRRWHGPVADGVTLAPAEGGVCAVDGVLAAGVVAGLKPSGRRDLALVDAGAAVTAAAVLTTNQIRAAPVEVTARHVADGRARAVLLNSGSANACTGAEGRRAAEASAAEAAAALGCAPDEVLVCSTGVIGVALPPLGAGIAGAAAGLRADGGGHAAEAILTTDLVAKEAAVTAADREGACVVGGMAKGSGMVAPSLATMLCVLTTDAALAPAEAHELLAEACAATFGRITVDGCLSTNDTVVLLATGAAPAPPGRATVAEGLRTVCGELAERIVRDGEGAERFVRLTVTGAADAEEAAAAARGIADSVLVRTALAGGDPNWGRILGAVGATPVRLDPDGIDVAFGGVTVCRDGTAAPFDRGAAEVALAGPDVDVAVDLGVGPGEATVLTCDLTHGYVEINAEYTT